MQARPTPARHSSGRLSRPCCGFCNCRGGSQTRPPLRSRTLHDASGLSRRHLERSEGPRFVFCRVKFVPPIAHCAHLRSAAVGASQTTHVSPASQCTHSTVRIFSNNVLACPVVHQQNSRTAYGMNQPPLGTAQFLFDTNENPLSFLTPSKQRLIAISIRCKFLTPSKQRPIGISIRYKFRLFAQSPFRNSLARRAASRRSPLVPNRYSPIAHTPLP